MYRLSERAQFERQLREMLTRQRDLDEQIFEEFNLDGYDDDRIDYDAAILDEIGELNHELKPSWCWWKKNVGKVNKERVLEEFVDIVHFFLSHCLQIYDCNIDSIVSDCGECKGTYGLRYNQELKEMNTPVELMKMFVKFPLMSVLLALAEKLGFTWTDVYTAYKTKNAENHNRLERGY